MTATTPHNYKGYLPDTSEVEAQPAEMTEEDRYNDQKEFALDLIKRIKAGIKADQYDPQTGKINTSFMTQIVSELEETLEAFPGF